MKNQITALFSKRRLFYLPLLYLFFMGISYNLQAQCGAPAGLTVISQTTTTATLQWTSPNTPIVDHCWTIEVGAAGFACGTGQQVFTSTVCTNTAGVTWNNATGVVSYIVTGLQPGTDYQYSLVETCDGFVGNSGSCLNAVSIVFTTFDDNPTVTFTATAPSCPAVSPGYVPNGSFSVSIGDGASCTGLYDIVATPDAGSGPLGNTPPFSFPSIIFNATDAGSPYLFTGAGAGTYTIQVFELGLCNHPTNPTVITVVVPDGTDNQDPIWQIADVIDNVLADNNIFTIPGTTANQGNINIPQGSCSFQQQLYATGFDLCDDFITNPAAVRIVSVNTVPASVNPATQVSVVPDGFGTYLIDINWSVGITVIVLEMCDASNNCPNLTLIANVVDDIDPSITCPPSVTKECVMGLDISPAVCGFPTVTDNCDPNPTATFSDATTPGNCDGNYTVTRTWTGSDQFNLTATCTQVINIQDTQAPLITCPATSTIECTESTAPANTGTATATDACDPNPSVTFSDVIIPGDCPQEMTIERTWTATDDCGNSSQCLQIINVEDTTPAVITCPPGQTLTCFEDVPAAVTTAAGFVASGGTISDNCTASLGEFSVSHTDSYNGGTNCPGDALIVMRTYIIADACGNESTCTQTFTYLESTTGPVITMLVPTTYVDCVEGINPTADAITFETDCDFGATVNITGPTQFGPGNCPGTIYRYTYSVTDDCGRTSFPVTRDFVIDNEGPTMECPDNCEVLSCYDGDYNAVIEAWLNTVSASSSCSVDLTVYNDYDGVNGICITNGFTPVSFWATDACGRTVNCESGIFITDTDAPDIYQAPQDLLIPCTANTEQIFSDWLADNGGAEAVDACGGPVTWSADTGVNALNCANGPQAIVVTFTATDECGNSASVVGIFNTKLLPNAVNVAGLIQTEAAEAVASVAVAAYQPSGMTEMNMSTETGDYHFEELPYEENTEIVPSRDDDYLNGVTTFDLILLQQHILGVQNLNSPYKQIAADANRSGTISTLDLVLLRRLILHVDEELADNTSWRFVDADFVFPNPTNPFETDFPEVYMLSGLEEELKDFVAVKIGDLNLDAATNSFTNQGDDRNGLEELIFEIGNQKLKAGEIYQIEVTAQNFAAIRGFQMTLDYDYSLVSVLDIKRGALSNFDEANFNLTFANAGHVPMSWNDQVARDLSFGDAAFSIIIKANTDVQLSEVLSMSSSMTKAEAYSNELMNVSLSYHNNGHNVSTDIGFQLFQNQPNPFKDATTIGFQLPEAGAVTLEIFDVTGKLIYVERGDYAEGYHQIDLDRANLQAGILYYQVSTASDSESKKMIVIE
jgi:hypothetical protein